jgi:hypothetical protein
MDNSSLQNLELELDSLIKAYVDSLKKSQKHQNECQHFQSCCTDLIDKNKTAEQGIQDMIAKLKGELI